MTPSLITVIDDDASVRRSLSRLFASEGYGVETFASADAWLKSAAPAQAVCLVLDVQMPGLNGMELQEELAQRKREDQIVFITGHGDVPMCAKAMKAGAVDFLAKPFRREELLQAVARAAERLRANSAEHAARAKDEALRGQARAKIAKLTPRELEVFRWIIAGLLNKQIAAELGTAEQTVKIQRGHITAKLGVVAVADMVRLAQQAGVEPGARS
jgi:FixJ family two-component response regulator